MAIEKRIYGTDELIFFNNNTEVHFMRLRKGALSSVHRHHKLNWFYCVEGLIEVRIYEDNGKDIKYTLTLEAGEKCKVSSPQLHQFLALEDTLLIEIYSVPEGEKIDVDDIERISIGGLEKLYKVESPETETQTPAIGNKVLTQWGWSGIITGYDEQFGSLYLKREDNGNTYTVRAKDVVYYRANSQ